MKPRNNVCVCVCVCEREGREREIECVCLIGMGKNTKLELTGWLDGLTNERNNGNKIDQFLTFDNRVELGQTRSRSCHSWLDKWRANTVAILLKNRHNDENDKTFLNKRDISYHSKQNWLQDLILPSNSFYSLTNKCSSLLVKLE